MRKIIIVAAAVSGAMLIAPLATPAQAQQTRQHQWCAKRKGMVDCRYSTEKQCRASVSGRGGQCIQRRTSR